MARRGKNHAPTEIPSRANACRTRGVDRPAKQCCAKHGLNTIDLRQASRVKMNRRGTVRLGNECVSLPGRIGALGLKSKSLSENKGWENQNRHSETKTNMHYPLHQFHAGDNIIG